MTASTLDNLGRVSLADLGEAVGLYLGLAYPGTSPPEVVRRRLDWDPSVSTGILLSRPPFEAAGRGAGGGTIVALRLGNIRYPHMKLQVQVWDSSRGFLLSANTHDQALSLAADSPDAEAFRELQAFNQAIKESIESAWDAAGLPTFLGYLRGYIADHPNPE